jgi:type VI secretion system secreted protein Hcp
MSDIYMQIDGLKGESTDSEHKDWIELLSFNHSISQPASASASTAGGGTTGRSQHSDYSITKYVDLASPKLYEFASSGKHIKNVTIEMLRASGDKRVKYMLVVMEQVVISHVAPAGGGDFPSESVSFNYGTIKWTYTQQKRTDGTGGGNQAAGWDLTANKVAA